MAPKQASTQSTDKPEEGVAMSLVQRPSGGAQTWGLGRISHKKPGANNYIYDNSACKGTFIYVLDTGIRITHEQFRGDTTKTRRAIHGANFIVGQPVSSSCHVYFSSILIRDAERR
jgi:hypothetical protein